MIVWHIGTKRGIPLLLLKIYRTIKLPYFTISYLLRAGLTMLQMLQLKRAYHPNFRGLHVP